MDEALEGVGQLLGTPADHELLNLDGLKLEGWVSNFNDPRCLGGTSDVDYDDSRKDGCEHLLFDRESTCIYIGCIGGHKSFRIPGSFFYNHPSTLYY